jgi:site-specific DNA recombinase
MTSRQSATVSPPQKLRCAVYTRKSSEEGLEMEFNSLDAQRESCEAYVASQRPEGWILVPDRYDDGGFSGGTLERPALKRLRSDIEAGQIDVVVVYKIDRLSRSLMDFSRLVEVFDQHRVTFVSVTQSFNTTTSMGRLTLNVLLSFAQFEREVIGERIRDKFAASRKRGMWMGGWAPLGYEVRDRKLVVNEVDAKLVRSIFQRFLKTGSTTTLARELIAENVRNKYGKLVDKGILYKMLSNPVYIGVAVHKGVSYPGEHVGIIDRKIWDKVQARFQESPRKRAAASRAQTPSLLKGIIFDPTGATMSPTHTRKRGRLYRYYVSQTVLKQGASDCSVARVPAAEIEKIVIDQVGTLLLSPEIIVQTWRSARKSIKGLTESEVRDALQAFDPLWNQIFPAEQSRIIELLVERVDVQIDRVDIKLRIAGVSSLIGELTANSIARQDAA